MSDSWGTINRQGKEYALYPRLLAEAHAQGLRRITTEVVEFPSNSNGQLAIVHAEVETDKGTFSGIGDASPENVGRLVAPHWVRMAETRAKARALRDALNIDVLLEGEAEPEAVVEALPPRPSRAAFPPMPEHPTYQDLVDAAAWVYDNTHGVRLTLPETTDLAKIRDHWPYMQQEYQRLVNPAEPATKQQIEKIVALGKSLGKHFHGTCVLSTYGASLLTNQLAVDLANQPRQPVTP